MDGKYLAGKQKFWEELQTLVHGTSALAAQGRFIFPEFLHVRVLGWIKGNAGAAGNCVATLEGKLYDRWAVIGTLTVAANGTNEVTGQGLYDIRGFEELRASAIYTDAPGKQVSADFAIGISYE